MADTTTLENLIKETSRQRSKSSLLPENEAEIAAVWDTVSGHIEKQMLNMKGVSIPGFVTFSYSKLSVVDETYGLHRPVFHLAEKFLQTLGITQSKGHVSGDVPVVPLNYSSVSFETPYPRDTIESSVREVIHALERAVASGRNVELAFSGVGRLSVRNRRAKFRFFRTFISQIDASGAVTAALQNRPGTADSVMSERPPSRLGANTVMLPRPPDEKAGTMPTISEADEHVNSEESGPSGIGESGRESSGEDSGLGDESGSPNRPDSEDGKKEGQGEKEAQGRQSVRPPTRMNKVPLQVASVSGVSFGDGLQLQSNTLPPVNTTRGTNSAPETGRTQGSDEESTLRAPLPPIRRPPSASSHERPGSARKASGHIHPLDALPDKLSNSWSGERPCTCDEGGRAGQELCYLCHQRARRNIPVSFAEERARQEAEEERTINAFHNMKVAEFQLKQQEDRLKHLHSEQKTAAFNLGVSEAVKTRYKARPNIPHPSYLFQQRPLTPPRAVRAQVYAKDLSQQVQLKDETKRRTQADEALLDRLEQAQLAEELVAQRERFLQRKVELQRKYKDALDAQSRTSSKDSSAAGVIDSSADNAVFGPHDVTEEKLAERRNAAREVQRELADTIAKRRREALLTRIEEQRAEEDMLVKNAVELQEERALKYASMLAARRQLEEEWLHAASIKADRDAIEARDRTADPGIPMHEQMTRYGRCRQCRRRLDNSGEWNIWADTRYLPGTRYFV